MIRGVFCVAALVAALALAIAPLRAQTPAPSDVPLMGSEAAPGDVPALSSPPADPNLATGFGGADSLYRVLVIGDNLAGGFGAGLTRMVESDTRFEIVNRFNEASGLARPEIYDWADAAPKILATRPYDAVLIHVGVNDRQPIRTEGQRLEFKTPAWEAAYTERIHALLDVLKAAGVKVFWVALPPMADPEFDADMQYLNGLYRTAVTGKGGVFVDERRTFTAPDGRYVDRGPDETGEDRKLRSRDGITFLRQGNSRMGQLLAAAIKAAEASDTPLPQIAAAAPAQSADGAPQAPLRDVGLPQFGQQGLDGEDMAFTPSLSVARPAAQPAGKAAILARPKPEIAAQTGSKAEALFVQGISPNPEPGRFDDFGVVAVP